MDLDSATIVNSVANEKRTKEGLKVGDKYPTEYVTSRGFKLKLRAVSAVTIWEAQSRVKEPPVPTFYDTDADRDRPNPLDPTYRNALTDASVERARVGQYIRLGLGTELVRDSKEDFKAKYGLEPVESTAWSEILELGGMTPAKEGLARYIDWLRLYALTDQDQNYLITAIERAGATVTEDEVEAAEDSFRDNTIREVVKEVSAN